MNKGTEEWLQEDEDFGPRWTRFIEEYETGLLNIKRIIEWCDAAYGRGYNDALRLQETNKNTLHS
jgi:hypothetical protein